MDEFEPPTVPFAAEHNLIHHKQRGQIRQIKTTDAGRCHSPQRPYVTARCLRQKPAQPCQLQTSIRGSSSKRCGQFRCSPVEIFERMAPLQSQGWLQSPMKPVSARCHRDVMQIGQVGLRHLNALRNVPAQSGRAEIGQRPLRRRMVNRKSSV